MKWKNIDIPGLHISEIGQDNSMAEPEAINIADALIVNFNGSGNKIVFGRDVEIKKLKINIHGDNNKILIGKNSVLSGVLSCKENGNIISIGKFTTIGGAKIECEYGTKIEIGEDCMFSIDIVIRSGDSHSIIDLVTGKRVNLSESISIGNHVWMGYGSSIGKGAAIMTNTVIGSRSFVNKKFDEGNCIIAGTPAKIVKRNTIWDRRSLAEDVPSSHIDKLKEKYLFVGK